MTQASSGSSGWGRHPLPRDAVGAGADPHRDGVGLLRAR